MALRIKQNVDLKELEKYGMNYDETFKEYYHTFLNSDRKFDNVSPVLEKLGDKVDLIISSKDRKIYLHTNSYTVHIPNVLWDLIRLDLVEKVKE